MTKLTNVLLQSHEKYGEIFKFSRYDKVIVCTTNPDSVRDILITYNLPKSDFVLQHITYPIGMRYRSVEAYSICMFVLAGYRQRKLSSILDFLEMAC